LTDPEVHPSPYPPELEIIRQNRADGMTLTVRGEIDLASAPALERELRDVESRARRIVLDLAGLEFMDSSGLHALIDAQRRAEINGHELVLTHVPAHAQRLFSLIGINGRFTVE
jgi:anti-anti-sigma factor